MGQKPSCFCDTTQIDIFRCPLATRTIIRAPMDNGCKLTSFDVHSLHVPSYVPRWITGGNPSTSTEELSFPFKPPSKVHSTDASGSAHTNQNSLYIRSLCLLLFLIGLICFLMCFSILNHLSFVNSKMKNFLIQNDLI